MKWWNLEGIDVIEWAEKNWEKYNEYTHSESLTVGIPMQIGNAYKLVTLLLNTVVKIRRLPLKLVKLNMQKIENLCSRALLKKECTKNCCAWQMCLDE